MDMNKAGSLGDKSDLRMESSLKGQIRKDAEVANLKRREENREKVQVRVSHSNLTVDMKTTGNTMVEAVNTGKGLKRSQNVKEKALNDITNKLDTGPIKLKPSLGGLSGGHGLQQKGIKRMNQMSIEKEVIELMDLGTLNNPK